MRMNGLAVLCFSILINIGTCGEPADGPLGEPAAFCPEELARELARGAESPGGLEQLAQSTLEFFGPSSETGRLIVRALAGIEGGDARELLRALELARGNLEFQPLIEAPLPEGWPETTPVDRIAVKRYPAYRAAWVDSKGERPLPENRMFMTLFRHIQRERIAMTAPVEMGYGEGRRPSSMAFLYRQTGQGKLGSDGLVEVADLPEGMAVSVGLRGVLSEARLADARERLERWLESREGLYEKAGTIRVLGYNSPFVPWFRRYSEVQIPIRARSGADG